MRQELANQRRDAAVARIAARQQGVLSLTQLNDCGVDSSGVKRRVAAGRLHRLHRGVYAVGHAALSNEGRWMAAVLACGRGAVVSHRSAAGLWRILPAPGRGQSGWAGAWVDVTVPGNGGRARRRGIRLHRSITLSPAHCTIRTGIPVTTPSRTLADLRPVLSSTKFASALREAEFLKVPIGDRTDADRTGTELEALFLSLCRRHRLPQPEVNILIDRYEVDFLWRDEHLVVEVDGWESHQTRSAFEEDRARDSRLKVLGYEVVRFTWRQVENDSAAVVHTVRTLLRD
jgi:very-short-patch-repair endonuclease